MIIKLLLPKNHYAIELILNQLNSFQALYSVKKTKNGVFMALFPNLLKVAKNKNCRRIPVNTNLI